MEPSSQSAAAERGRLASQRSVLALRARAMAALHRFFQARDFLHVETPVRVMAPALEDYIDAEPSGAAWLRTSPELHMKRLLAAGYERLYQVGPCFRHGERGQRHQPEFAMLEWYRLRADWRDILGDTVALLREVTREVTGGSLCRVRGVAIDVDAPWSEITVDEAFARYADTSLDAALAAGRFEEVLVAQVEPRLGLGVPTVLSEYPLACSGLSRPIPGRPDRVERWELYLAGMELGNACSELVDAAEQRRRFAACAALRRADGRAVYPLDEAFLGALDLGMPPAAGIAIGLDRLVMALAGAASIDEVIAFPA
ncbi:MAG: EF-P lysine aminoacylase GenX [Lentisphaerae bacterium]|nr:EF-P lysine aminoacylase GenX [Lentisphaerota bacterium]